MKLLIDIPEHIYEHAKEMTEDSIDEGKAMRAIANGSPLPKEHGDIIAEKERLIKKDMGSIENRVRHAFNQGYEMGLKEGCSEIPNTCGDAISRQAVLNAFWKLNVELSPTAIWTIQNMVKDVPSVTPQQRTGRWEWVQYDSNPNIGNWHCSECRCVVVECVGKEEKGGIPLYKYCPQCGAKMVEPQER